jgi:hypothetical protein
MSDDAAEVSVAMGLVATATTAARRLIRFDQKP